MKYLVKTFLSATTKGCNKTLFSAKATLRGRFGGAVLFCLCLFLTTTAQETIYPAPQQKETITLTNATIHVGNGNVITNGNVVITNGKITEVGATTSTAGKIIDCKGKHIYPGLILTSTQIGLVEVPTVRATVDARAGRTKPQHTLYCGVQYR
jgi:hypothetical protein